MTVDTSAIWLDFVCKQLRKLVFFREAAEHILRAVRVFRQPGGHLLLVRTLQTNVNSCFKVCLHADNFVILWWYNCVQIGLDGTGKSTTVQMAALIGGQDVCRLTPARAYGPTEFRDDLKKAYVNAGVKGKDTIFLLTDDDIIDVSVQVLLCF